jgi:ADP-ribose pyrophosphatase
LPAGAFHDLGPYTYPVPAMIAERHVYFHVEVEEGARGTPLEDGSALERHALVTTAAVDDVLDWCRRGWVRDAKTELALRRLRELP